jgi:GDP-4-dehydro-6-deoxy-D-mannose reductase
LKVLVTGGTGFAGRHLINELLRSNYQVVTTYNREEVQLPNVQVRKVDLTDSKAVSLMDLKGVEAIYNLAGLAAVGASFSEPFKYLEVNSRIQINLFEACLKQEVKPKFLIISSANIYCADELPLTENSKVLPVSPYAVSKVAQEYIGQYYGTRGFEVTIARSFNHMGPGQMEGFIVADLAKQIVAAEKSGGDVLQVGNLDAKRDYTDVRDIARAYRLLMEKGRAGEIYNVCSGSAVSGHQILDGLLANSKAQLEVRTDPSLMRPVDKPEIYGSSQKIKNDTGWQPKIPLEQTLKETLEDWRNKAQ